MDLSKSKRSQVSSFTFCCTLCFRYLEDQDLVGEKAFIYRRNPHLSLFSKVLLIVWLSLVITWLTPHLSLSNHERSYLVPKTLAVRHLELLGIVQACSPLIFLFSFRFARKKELVLDSTNGSSSITMKDKDELLVLVS